jgi:hypothetical protein
MKKVIKHTRLILLWIFVLASYSEVQSQGCSDAGLCTIDALKPAPGSPAAQHRNKLDAGVSVGGADYDITAFGGYIGYSRKFGESWHFDGKMTFLAQSGNDISVSGPGDIFANISYDISETVTLTAGTKIPLNKADRELDGKALPMDYQSSLGTFDLLAGIRYNPEKWQLALAVQVPLAQNENRFFPELYAPGTPLYEIQATNAFQRQADILFHISRTFDLSDKLTMTPGLLPIYHVGEDEFTDIDGIDQAIEGSDGLTLNATVYFDLKMSDAGSLEFNIGFPLIVREARPDGLTRSFVFGVGYSHAF